MEHHATHSDENAHADINEDIPLVPPKTEELPKIGKEQPGSAKSKGIEKALEILDEYNEGVPPLNPNFQHDDDHV